MGKAGCLVSYIDMDWVVVRHHNNFYQDTYLKRKIIKIMKIMKLILMVLE